MIFHVRASRTGSNNRLFATPRGGSVLAMIMLFMILWPAVPAKATTACPPAPPTSPVAGCPPVPTPPPPSTPPPPTGCPNCLCVTAEEPVTESLITANATTTQTDIVTQFQLHETTFMVPYFVGALQDMAQQLTTAGMMQMNIIGSFLDARQQLEVQRLFQQKAAEAHKDYQSSMEMCAIGTVARGLGSAESNGEMSAAALAKRSQDRQIHAENVNGAFGGGIDAAGRLALFKARYCDSHDLGGALISMCKTSAPAISVDKDISVNRTIWQPNSLNVLFSGSGPTGDEQDVLALDANLYAHTDYPPIAPGLLSSGTNQSVVLDQRAIIAKRSVAENSFAAIVGMKSAMNSSSTVEPFMQKAYQQLGVVPLNDQGVLVPVPASYYSEMEILTKTLYEDPRFYTNLYDTPANLARKGAAIRALNLMQHWDFFKSRLRSEAILAELVELDIDAEQADVQNSMNRMKGTGAKQGQ